MTREELIECLTTLQKQARRSGANTFIWDVNLDSFNFVIDNVLNKLRHEPRKVRAHIEEKSMELKDTITEMISEDYKERYKAEYHQLFIRREKLSATLDKWAHGKLKFEPRCSFALLTAQLSAMSAYQMILKERARIDGIDL